MRREEGEGGGWVARIRFCENQGSYSQHSILFITYEWEQLARVLHYNYPHLATLLHLAILQ
jgi:hypothetical protein